MQFVFFYDFFAHGLKRPEADMQRDLDSFDSTLVYALKNFRREMQARRRRGHGAEGFRVDRLVRLAVRRRVGAIDVGRQRNVADAIERAEEVVHRIEAQMALAKGPTTNDLSREFM